jgi:tryptophan 2,3-dioxygenase
MSQSSDPRGASLAPTQPFGPLTYGSYLKVPELLQLQRLLVPERSHDELLFIIIHQAYELWFKQILFELDTVARLIPLGELREARRLIERVVAIERLLVDQIHILETMTPRDFCHFRQGLAPASGFQSIQFREVEFLSGVRDPHYLRYLAEGSDERAALQRRLDAPSLRDILYGWLRQQGFAIAADPDADDTSLRSSAEALLPVYRDIEAHAEVYDLCEALVSHDEWLVFWRFHHVRVVERIIGFKPGTGGSHGVRYLDSTVSKRAFPVLWAARALLDESELFAGYNPPV